MPAVSTLAAAGLAAAGAGASLYGAKKQSSAIKKASEDNAAAQAASDERNYQMWLESRGVGQNGQAINTKLPRWATWKSSAVKPTP